MDFKQQYKAAILAEVHRLNAMYGLNPRVVFKTRGSVMGKKMTEIPGGKTVAQAFSGKWISDSGHSTTRHVLVFDPEGWKTQIPSDVVAHEYSHLLQYERGQMRGYETKSKVRQLERSADVFARHHS